MTDGELELHAFSVLAASSAWPHTVLPSPLLLWTKRLYGRTRTASTNSTVVSRLLASPVYNSERPLPEKSAAMVSSIDKIHFIMANEHEQPTLDGIILEAPIEEKLVNPAAKKLEKTRARTERKFPPLTFADALVIGEAIQRYAAGQRVRRLKLFEQLNKSPDSSTSRQLVTSSGQYGVTKGGYTAEYLELTSEGHLATAEDTQPAKLLRTQFDLSIAGIVPFSLLYEKYKGNKIPAREILADNLNEISIPQSFQDECVDTFIVNAKRLNLLRTIAGSERLIPVEQAMEDLPSVSDHPRKSGSESVAVGTGIQEPSEQSPTRKPTQALDDFANLCFYVTPIGDAESPERKHADFLLEYIVRPALSEFNLTVIRADQMSQPGMIGRQVVEHILKCRLVIADLSFHNPNVFYELCLRHTTRLPTVQIKRESDRLPFDLNQQRTISINTSDVYELYPKLQTHISEVATQVRRALQDLESADNPISLYYPKAKLSSD